MVSQMADNEKFSEIEGLMMLQAAEVINGVPGNDATTVTIVLSTITLIDTNTSPPMFDQSNYTGTIVEHSLAGTAVPNLYMVITDANHVRTAAMQSIHLFPC